LSDNVKKGELGLAAEYRVMAELILRGLGPTRVGSSNFDLLLNNGIRVEVKASRRNQLVGSEYHFTTKSAQRNGGCDFFVCWCFDDDVFYVIPGKRVEGGINITPENSQRESRKDSYKLYKNAWSLLKRRR